MLARGLLSQHLWPQQGAIAAVQSTHQLLSSALTQYESLDPRPCSTHWQPASISHHSEQGAWEHHSRHGIPTDIEQHQGNLVSNTQGTSFSIPSVLINNYRSHLASSYCHHQCIPSLHSSRNKQHLHSTPHQLQQLAFVHKHSKHGMHAPQAWAKEAKDKARIIAALGTLDQLEVFWSQWGGAPAEILQAQAKGVSSCQNRGKSRSSDVQPCRLSYLNIANFIQQLQRLCPHNLLHPTYPVLPDEQIAQVYGWTSQDVSRALALTTDACAKLQMRSKLIDPITVSQVLISLAKLGYVQDQELIAGLLEKAAARLPEAYTRHLQATAKALAMLEYKGGQQWWQAAWQEVGAVLPTGMYHPQHIEMIIKVANQLGHTVPPRILQYMDNTTAMQGQHQEQMQIAHS